MAYEFKKLGEVEALEEVPDGANALIEVNGDIKRVPGTGLGGGGGIKTAIIKSSEYDNAIAGVQTALVSVTHSCINMTFEEAYTTMAAGEPLAVMFMLNVEGAACLPGITGFAGDAMGVPCVMLRENLIDITLYWTEDGLSTSAPETNE